jgi:MFS family permease
MTDQHFDARMVDSMTADAPARRGSARLWQAATVRLAVALAFADASIVVLALPEIVPRLHTSISRVPWVITSYNVALIVTAVGVIPFARRLDSTRVLIAGLALFGLASIGCGLANSMSALVPLRCLQGVGGGLLLCASLPMLASTVRAGDSPLSGWSAAAAIGVAVGPAVGGILTQVFDWRAIFLAQAPVAALGVILVVVVRPRPVRALSDEVARGAAALDPLIANGCLALLSAAVICALFLVVLMVINAWLLSPIAAAAVVSTIPLATAIAQRRVRGSSPIALGAVGSALVAAGLIGLSFVTHRELGLVVITLALVGTGLGLAFPGLTTAALHSGGAAAARAAKTVAARDAGIVLGLLVLTPVFVNQLNNAPKPALAAATTTVVGTPIRLELKLSLARGLVAAYKHAPQSQLPDFGPPFALASAHATPAERASLRNLHSQLDSIVQHAATNAFKLPLRYGAVFAIAVLPLLSVGLIYRRRRDAARSRLPGGV